MKDNKQGFLLQTVKQMNNGAIVSGIGFLLYVAASALTAFTTVHLRSRVLL